MSGTPHPRIPDGHGHEGELTSDPMANANILRFERSSSELEANAAFDRCTECSGAGRAQRAIHAAAEYVVCARLAAGDEVIIYNETSGQASNARRIRPEHEWIARAHTRRHEHGRLLVAEIRDRRSPRKLNRVLRFHWARPNRDATPVSEEAWDRSTNGQREIPTVWRLGLSDSRRRTKNECDKGANRRRRTHKMLRMRELQ
jgi:hypothetical protein